MSTHTPGPWHAERLAVFDANGSLIAEVHEDYFTHTEEDASNARLIAAAPELLQTLVWLDSIGGLGLNVHERISSAIRKATGE